MNNRLTTPLRNNRVLINTLNDSIRTDLNHHTLLMNNSVRKTISPKNKALSNINFS